MPTIQINLPDDLDKSIDHAKIDMKLKTKAEVIVILLYEYFKKIEVKL